MADMYFILPAVAVLLVFRWLTRRRLNFPPGPRPDPIIGNLRQMTFDGTQEEMFAEWRKTYGDVIHARVFGREMVILNSLTAAQDLMEKRSLNYSCRPRMVLMSELMGWDSVITNMPYGERFRKHRRLIQDHFNQQAALEFRPLQRRESCLLLAGLLDAPDAFDRHVRRFAAGTIMKIAYGHTVNSVDELYVGLAEDAATDTVKDLTPGSMLVDFFPALKNLPAWMPGAGFKRRAFKTKVKVRKMLDTPYQMVQNTMAAGTAIPSFTSDLIDANESGKSTAYDEEDIKGAAGTSALLVALFLAMTLHPEVLKKVQAELDEVVGFDRLPDFADRPSLPYLECVMKELYRWSAPVPLGIPHRCMKDDEYRGYDIPADTMVIPNIWAMTRDEDIYMDPHRFFPERFWNQDPETAEATDPKNLVFGFGRRECPGKFFGDSNVWLITASVISTFSIKKAVGDDGKEITPLAKFSSGFVRHPDHFPCEIKPRSRKAEELIHQTLASTA
ncbi:cytochrome P450 [Dentipellis sp. KUC8613]|nr:cytochrome P450 [Dentipellis sp. KUC8613]